MTEPQRIKITVRRKITTAQFPGLQILDHAEVCNLSNLFKRSPVNRQIVIDLSGVLSLPSGFFGVLLDGVEAGHSIKIKNTTPEVEKLIGFQKFVKRGTVHL